MAGYKPLLRRFWAQAGHAAAEQTRQSLAPPALLRDGPKRTLWTNFAATCARLAREPAHVAAFVSAEIGRPCAPTAAGGLSLAGAFNPRNVQRLLVRYIRQYVMCGECRGGRTALAASRVAGERAVLTCGSCGATRSVTRIAGGYASLARGARRKQQQ